MPDSLNYCILIKLVILCFKILSSFKLLLWFWLIVFKRHAYSYGILGAYKGTGV
jgi:hypothetical protein